MTTEVFKSGDPVPRSWFTKLTNVETMYFMHPCIVETTDSKRTIRKVRPALEGPMIHFNHVKDSDGTMDVQFDRETEIFIDYSAAEVRELIRGSNLDLDNA
jgi:hypothetical protein